MTNLPGELLSQEQTSNGAARPATAPNGTIRMVEDDGESIDNIIKGLQLSKKIEEIMAV